MLKGRNPSAYQYIHGYKIPSVFALRRRGENAQRRRIAHYSPCGVLLLPLTNDYKTLMAKEETYALEREEQAPPLRLKDVIRFVAVKKFKTV